MPEIPSNQSDTSQANPQAFADTLALHEGAEHPFAATRDGALDLEGELTLELHEFVVWSSDISFSHQLPDVFISPSAAR